MEHALIKFSDNTAYIYDSHEENTLHFYLSSNNNLIVSTTSCFSDEEEDLSVFVSKKDRLHLIEFLQRGL
jgi:hypothetical protein